MESELRVEHAGELIARTDRGVRVVETAGAPVYYFPPEAVRTELLEETGRTSFCEWKGRAHYHDLVVGDERVPQAAWSYPDPTSRFTDLAGWIAFYAGKVDTARVGDMAAAPQPGGFYGGWVTPDLAGPIKGEPGSAGW